MGWYEFWYKVLVTSASGKAPVKTQLRTLLQLLYYVYYLARFMCDFLVKRKLVWHNHTFVSIGLFQIQLNVTSITDSNPTRASPLNTNKDSLELDTDASQPQAPDTSH